MGEDDDAEEINRQWEDAIDEDSDLLHLLSPSHPSQILKPTGSLPALRPCSRDLCSSQLSVSHFQEDEGLAEAAEAGGRREAVSRIPGPAGGIQAAMHRRSTTDVLRGGSCLEEQRRGERSLGVDNEDGDFELNPWLCAVELLGNDFGLVSPISSITSRTGDRVSQVVGIIKSCTPNGLGDFLVTLKDPTGCIGATMHHRVLLEHNLSRNISVGCVMILKQVVVFHPARSVQYLNVTANNLVKLIRNDCGPPDKQKLWLPSVHSDKMMKTSIERKEQNFMQYGAGKSIDEEHNRSAATKSSLIAPHVNERIADKSGSGYIRSGHLVDAESSMMNSLAVPRNLNNQRMSYTLEMNLDRGFPFNTTVSDTLMSKEISQPPEKDVDIILNVAVDPSETNKGICGEEVQRSSNPQSTLGTKDRFSVCPSDLHVDHSTASTVMHAKPDFRLHGAENTISKDSVTQWTGEQLMELFADYHDTDLL